DDDWYCVVSQFRLDCCTPTTDLKGWFVMGTTIVEGKDVSIQRYDGQGQPSGKLIVTPFVAVRGTARATVLAQGAAETQSEKQLPGSDEWLTLIAIADTKDRLAALVDTTTTAIDENDVHTSASSRRVRIELHTDDDGRATLHANITIASGNIV